MVYYAPGSEGAKRQQERWSQIEGEHVKGQLLLGFAKGTTEAEARRIVESRGGTLDKWFGASGGGAITINNPSGNIEEDIKKFSAGPSVRYAEKNVRVSPMRGMAVTQQTKQQPPQNPRDSRTGDEIWKTGTPEEKESLPGWFESYENYVANVRPRTEVRDPVTGIISKITGGRLNREDWQRQRDQYLRTGGSDDYPNPNPKPEQTGPDPRVLPQQPLPGAPPDHTPKPAVNPAPLGRMDDPRKGRPAGQPQIGAPPDNPVPDHTPRPGRPDWADKIKPEGVPWEDPNPKPKPKPVPEPEPEPLPDQPAGAGEGYRQQEQKRAANTKRIKGWQGDLDRLQNLLNVPESSRLAAGGKSDAAIRQEMAGLNKQIEQTQKFVDSLPASTVDPAPAPAPAPAPVQQAPPPQQPPPGLSQQEWGGMDIGLPDRGLPGSQPSMMDLWGGGGQQAPTQQWGGQQGWQMQQQGQSFQDPITGRTLDRRTGQPVQQGPQGHTRWADIPEHIRNSPEMKAEMNKGGWSPNESTSINLSQFMSRNPMAGADAARNEWQQQMGWGGWQDAGGQQGWGGSQPSLTNIWQQQQGGGQMAQPGGGMMQPGGPGGMQPGQGMLPGGQWGGFPGAQMPPWATLPDPGLAEQAPEPLVPGPGLGQPGQNIPGAGVVPGLPPVIPQPGPAPEFGQYGQEVTQAASAKLQQAPQSAVPSGSPVVYPSSQPIAPTNRQGGGGRRGGGGASPFSYGVKVS